MTVDIELLRTEHSRAEDAALASDEQVRSLPALLMKAQGAEATMTALDVSKIAAATLAVNQRLQEQLERARKAVALAEARAERLA